MQTKGSKQPNNQEGINLSAIPIMLFTRFYKIDQTLAHRSDMYGSQFTSDQTSASCDFFNFIVEDKMNFIFIRKLVKTVYKLE